MEQLPYEMILHILAFLDPRDAAAVSSTHSNWRDLMLCPHLWRDLLSTRTDRPAVVRECLRRVCLAGSLPLAQIFVALGAEVGAGHLGAAVRGGNLQVVSFILNQAGTDLQLHLDGIFECAARQGNVGLLEFLLRVAVPTSNQTIAEAARSGSLEAVQLLLDHGCYDRKYTIPDPIKFAIVSGNSAIVQLLVQYGVTLQAKLMAFALSQAETPSMEMLQHLAPALNPEVWRDCLTSPPLQRGEIAVCRFLVDNGVDINYNSCVVGGGLGTALQYAVGNNYEAMAQCLLKCGALNAHENDTASQVVTTHRPGKRKRKSTSEAADKKNKEGKERKKADERGKTKPAKKKPKRKESREKKED